MPVVPMRTAQPQRQRLPQVPAEFLAMAAADLHDRGMLIEPSKDTVDADGFAHHEQKMQRIETQEQNQMMDQFRSIDDIVKEGSNPSAQSRFRSSSSRNPDK